jgi:glycosyltransferase involved in cell wall biosynthesis
MKILLISGSLTPIRCGVGDYTLRLARFLAADPKVSVGILTSFGVAPSDSSSLEIFPIMTSWTIWELGRFIHIVRRWSPDVIHIQYPTQGYRQGRLPKLIPIISFLLGVKVARTWHEIPKGRELLDFLLEALVPGAHVVVRPNFYQSIPKSFRPLIANQAGGFIRGSSTIPASMLSKTERRVLKRRFSKGRRRLVAYFGFLHPAKGVELLFDIADASTDHIIIVGEGRPMGVDDDYCNLLRLKANQGPWHGGVTFAGYLSNENTADVLAAADAVLLPFRSGGGIWNSSIHAVVLQGTPLITTAMDAMGYDAERNVYFCAPGDILQMKHALVEIAGRRVAFNPDNDRNDWRRIANLHINIYEKLMLNRGMASG